MKQQDLEIRLKMDRLTQFNKKQLIEIYDQRAEEIINNQTKPFRKHTSRKNLEITKYLKEIKGERIIDVGAGRGIYTTSITHLEFVNLIVLTDISPTMLQTAKQNLGTESSSKRICYIACDMESLPFKINCFDSVINSQVIEHLLDDKEGLRELYRILKPGGVLIISTDNKKNYISKFISWPVEYFKAILKLKRQECNFPHKKYFTEEFRTMLIETGFIVKTFHTFRFSLASPLWQIELLTYLLDKIERFFIRLPLVRNWGDIILAVCHKQEYAI